MEEEDRTRTGREEWLWQIVCQEIDSRGWKKKCWNLGWEVRKVCCVLDFEPFREGGALGLRGSGQEVGRNVCGTKLSDSV